ncbi:2-succinyl-5-enolpyruvyl-6-hydroxy-3-cyclohexene-1-carboxylic-acid synthase [Lederbergia wuyishanensis]|uniref:2-succinyl-5-enolpyruvyl-6-hydroxy-3-cyclohexene-1-carboxylate synthase n=1 Tax=Lederbergia wuyishanensis TaxID=1347903 RepID=A0ABU0D4T4_9BACI|nr:2-succinyl-5-enolpyruvyl-6-hydroxy-3-cyclohexene-1-carboxylic-acid synthase [Lederbergia wuyishanensis]MCJ8009499.1 2-succinyl-5-enolpyruvyl-6-hydroxy-3-cyclohexene-1-carboxylic-acid synthase [Lederbergia wuyishanensis]MDQ0343404.1 2-succinyl-5-enolpyruvyl-6-hydroxy-3-cyclohexene-1-carboxylate synthase [Lederbergia wuyishanensis]
MNHQEALTKYLAAFITGLVQAGIKDVVISPGSRSTPLALMFSEHRDVNVYMNVDERSAAFFALGLAKASGDPVGLLCTSGTATANYYPAIIEASLSGVPLIVMTADRPHELRDVGAPQAIDQLHLYGSHVKWFAEMALPESGVEQLRYAKTTAIRAVKEAMVQSKGPVHLNFPFREPLLPTLDPYPFEDEASISIEEGILFLPYEKLKKYAEQLQGIERGLIICGQIEEPGFNEAVTTLAKKLKFPILADPLSQLRSSSILETTVIDSYDAILRVKNAVATLKPELIIRFGGTTVSKSLSLYMKSLNDIEQIVVDSGSHWRDPNYVGTTMIHCDEKAFCNELATLIQEKTSSSWLSKWLKMDEVAKSTIRKHMQLVEELEEGKAVFELVNLLPVDSTVFVGNSMPIRDIDTFFHKNNKNISVMANRGANGIDGVVSTALGAAVYKRPLFLVIGDLSFFHDLNGLLMAKLHKLNITIILLNNDGGGIFSYLPQFGEPKHFEVLFGTPTGLNYEHAVQMYHGQYTKIFDWEGLKMAILDSVSYEGLNVIEIPTDRERNLSSHREMWEKVSQEIYLILQDVEK